jgi:hypothetical protein
MCDYSLHHVSSRPAKVADKLVTMELAKSSTRGFAAVGELGAKLVIHDSPPGMAVCLLPGTELAFDDDVQYDRTFSFLGKARVNHRVASFRQIDMDDPYIHHDALEFPNGQILKLTQLVAGQTATVLQLPVATQHHEHVHARFVARSSHSRLVLNRVSAGSASILMPSQGTVMLWDALRSTAIDLSTALVQSFRRLTAPKQRSILGTELFAGVDAEGLETSFRKGVLTPTLPNKPAAQKPEKKTGGVKAAA